LAQVVLSLFPHAVYVATDLAADFIGGDPQENALSLERKLTSLQTQTANPTAQMSDSLLHADCFDYPLIRKLIELLEEPNAVLVSMNALFALLDRNANPWTKKDENNQHSMYQILANCPYRAQLHLATTDIWNTEWREEAVAKYFLQMEKEAKEAGWETHRVAGENVDGLLLVRVNSEVD